MPTKSKVLNLLTTESVKVLVAAMLGMLGTLLLGIVVEIGDPIVETILRVSSGKLLLRTIAVLTSLLIFSFCWGLWARKRLMADLQRLKEEHAEEVHIYRSIEFRRGKRTGGQWLPFCPKCHLPTLTINSTTTCSNADCHWAIHVGSTEISSIVKQLK